MQLLAAEKTDSNRVKLLWRMAEYINIYNPDTALTLAQEALSLARSIKYIEGESRSLGLIANTFIKIGNYPRALDFNLQKLQIEEKRTIPRNLASVFMNIGIVHAYLEEYRTALEYYFKADSMIRKFNITAFLFNINLNIGDTYDRLNVLDSAFLFYTSSLREAKKLQNDNYIGASLTGLGHIYRKQSNFLLAKESYLSAITHLQAGNDDDLLCEVYLGLANLYALFNVQDPAIRNADTSYRIAKKDGFETRQLDAVKFLSDAYKKSGRLDSAFAYINLVQQMNDSVNSKNRIRESQILSSNEKIRQMELAAAKQKEQKERSQQLQMLFIGIFIPGFFLVTLLLSKIRLHIRFVKVLGILSLLIFFEYLTLLLHPSVAAYTNHNPVFEILIFVVIAAILIPLHHRAEHWLIHKLLHHRIRQSEEKV